jgi:hypothetical protein
MSTSPDGYGLQRRADWGERDLSPISAQAREDARVSTQARLEATCEEALKDTINYIAGELGEGRWRLPRGGSISWAIATVDRKERDVYGVMQWVAARPRVTGAALWPLPPMTIAELVQAGLLTARGINRGAYEKAVRELVL